MAVDVSTTTTTLSANDKRILDALFDPETLPSSVARSKDAAQIDSSLPSLPTISSHQLSTLETQQTEIIRQVSSTSSPATLETALEELDSTIATWPTYPSAYVNRAMLRRLRIEADMTSSSTEQQQHIFSVARSEDIEALFTDLGCAIQHALPSTSPQGPVSPYQARILRTAYSHRAFLYLKAAETETGLGGQSKTDLEELASKDFAAAARYGDEVAREMSVRTNPYAKMCGAIVRNALREEREMEGC
ncbi:hypothetical protein IAQ61_001994 [Plenodomus lingam]|uniref:Uncharacterized protein n=1 Tax=Leptosphaeria maculans (strain JN3 / isolate v23.1.3 / race Av1-4-5-6-7-8) TaxID=985895 RepID=E4ZGS0_LEPMJ|nr:hypothetical protein LEMA_P066160.1 [Plenodomus lingam JN3]KAH9878720.1 hypothetical protein IAQ61_001994 [Plenodomus lingam]CBX90490.1 hypothetical protein LEMA_P066160.1 [Plenodomus lingam JN3]